MITISAWIIIIFGAAMFWAGIKTGEKTPQILDEEGVSKICERIELMFDKSKKV